MEALEWIREGAAYDVAILDMQMPDMDGLTLAGEIRDLGSPVSKLPLIMVTSLGRKEDRPAGRKTDRRVGFPGTLPPRRQ